MAAKKPNPIAELAVRMLSALETRRVRGTYPTTLRDLADGETPAEMVLAVAGRKPFSERAFAARKKDLNSPVVLRDDLAVLADSSQLLTFALDAACTPEEPACPLDRVAAKAKLDAALKTPFTEALRRRVADRTLPAEIATTTIKKKTCLYWVRMPPPPPPKKPEVVLAERLLGLLEDAKRQGAARYPTTLRTLLAAAAADGPLAKKAVAQAAFKGGTVFASKSHPDTPLALAGDADLLCDSDLVLTFLLRGAGSEATRAFSADDLKKKLAPDLRGPFADAVDRRAADNALPAEVGWLPLKKKKVLFFVADVRRASAPSPLPQRAKATDTEFDAVFTRLDAAGGGHNFVSLVDLRRELPLDRAAFDALLARLRAAGRYSLSAAEGRHGLGDDARAAAIREDGLLLLYVSRRSP